MLIPMPPMTEQRRLVAMTNGLLRRCDIPMAQIARGQSLRERLRQTAMKGTRIPGSVPPLGLGLGQ